MSRKPAKPPKAAEAPKPAAADADHRRLLAEKAERLADLQARKPGQKGYKRSLRAFLEADAAAQQALLDRIEAVPAATPEPPAPPSPDPA
jgi:hypothetical protein